MSLTLEQKQSAMAKARAARKSKSVVNNNGNGHKDLVETDIVVTDEEIESKPRKTLLKTSFENAFTRVSGTNSLDLLAKAGDDPLDLLMRSKIPDWRTLTSYAILWRKCIECEFDAGVNEIRNMLAMAPSVGGISREQVVRAIVGDFSTNKGSLDGEGLEKRLRRAAFGK